MLRSRPTDVGTVPSLESNANTAFSVAADPQKLKEHFRMTPLPASPRVYLAPECAGGWLLRLRRPRCVGLSRILRPPRAG